jgi:hypothetical protein
LLNLFVCSEIFSGSNLEALRTRSEVSGIVKTVVVCSGCECFDVRMTRCCYLYWYSGRVGRTNLGIYYCGVGKPRSVYSIPTLHTVILLNRVHAADDRACRFVDL